MGLTPSKKQANFLQAGLGMLMMCLIVVGIMMLAWFVSTLV